MFIGPVKKAMGDGVIGASDFGESKTAKRPKSPMGSKDRATPKEEIQRRAKLLEAYKTATGIRANQRIYQAKNSGIHKPQFYEWRSGKLASESATAINFERFLSAKKVPIPRRQKA